MEFPLPLPPFLSLPPPTPFPYPLPSFHEQSVLKCLSYTRFSTTLYKWSEKKSLEKQMLWQGNQLVIND